MQLVEPGNTLAPLSQRHDALCLYHGNCMDGLLAAAVVHRFFNGDVECKAVHYGDEVPVELMRERNVFFVDFAFEFHQMLPHLDVPRQLTIIDHHKDNMAPWVALDNGTYPNLTIRFDNFKSGAGLAWDYFFGGEKPLLVRYAQEYDLWTKTLPNTDEVQSGLRYMFPPREAALAPLSVFMVYASEKEVEELRRIGSIILREEMTQIEAMIKRHLQFVEFLGYPNIPICAMPPELVNQAGELLYNRYPDVPFVVMFEDNYPKNTRKYSFRSRRIGGADVSEIAAKIGGKGHTNSSGALIPCIFNI